MARPTTTTTTFSRGDAVQTPLGKGVVQDVRNNGRLLVELKGRGVEVAAASVTRLEVSHPSRTRTKARRDRDRTEGLAAAAGSAADTAHPAPRTAHSAARSAASPRASATRAEVDLHGLTVEQALARADEALSEAMLADLPELRLVHGRSGGRIRAALHRRLSQIASVRSFRLEPGNPGATIVAL